MIRRALNGLVACRCPRENVIPRAIGLSDGVWIVVLKKELDVSQYREKSTVIIRATCPLTVISLPMGCAAFEESITLAPYYQAEEKF